MTQSTTASRLSASGAHALELEGVGRQFGALVALEGINLKVAAGERRAVLGSNGAGKTTLFNTISGDFPPTSGRITFFGEDITALPPHERIRRGLRRTYQISQLFGGLSVRDSVYLACRGDILVSVLSHGQQRQLEIALALAGAPRFILFDEPAAGLSPAERGSLVEILNSLPSHIGYIIIEHDLDVALKVSTSVTMMHNGSIFKEGTPEEIENDPEVQAIYLGGGHG
jgi:branched-chain amino acid transport system ATP-binding protein